MEQHSCARLFKGFLCFSVLAVVFVLVSCGGGGKDIIPSSAYAPYVSAFTGGVVSQRATIRVELTDDQPMVEVGAELKESPFRFSPKLKGKTYWVSGNTLEFVPEEGTLQPGELYVATFDLARFVKVEDNLAKFRFSFRVQNVHFTLQTERVLHMDNADIKGEIRFNEPMKQEDVAGMVKAEGAGNVPLQVTPTNDPTLFHVALNGIARETLDVRVKLKVDGKASGVDHVEETEVLIPAKGDFRFLSVERMSNIGNGLEIEFSDPLETTQDLKGLVELKGVQNFVTRIEGHKLYIYFEEPYVESMRLEVYEGIRNVNGQNLSSERFIAIAEDHLKPEVELTSSAVIMPDSKSLILPFRAVNLYAVDLRVVRIFEHNVLSFLQSNTLDGGNELRRWGRLVCKKTLWLTDDKSKDIHRWEDYSVDLSQLMQQEPGAIYRVILSFREEYSAYPCGGETDAHTRSHTDNTQSVMHISDESISDEELSEWDLPYAYYGFYPKINWAEYLWTERENPCHPTYYMIDRNVSCNVIASNLGIIVKRNSLQNLWITVNNILDTRPVKGARITAYNYQLQVVATGDTDGEGMARLESKGVPFLVMAEYNGQKSYVRVANGEELPVSSFDVGGKEISKGLKGYLFGERGVWRPGDTLHLSFILEDREHRIPSRHPVSLELYNPQGQFYSKQVSTEGTDGYYVFHVPTQADDPTGTWHAYAKVGGSAFHKSLLIETVKPNRLKIDLKLPPLLKAASKEADVELTSSWLTGAKASGLKAKVEMSLSRVNVQFPAYSSYIFNDPSREFTTVKQTVFDGKLDNKGKVSFKLKLADLNKAPGMLNATFNTRVFEPGGDASFYTQTVPYSPYDYYVGIEDLRHARLETGKSYKLKIVTLDSQGKPADRSDLFYSLYRIDWKWWWEHGEKQIPSYFHSKDFTLITRKSLETKNGQGYISFIASDDEWGQYLLLVRDTESGHVTGSVMYVDCTSMEGRAARTNPEGIKMFTFSLDKESYEPGETVTAILPASGGGRALLSLENGSTVLQQKWVEMSPQEDTKVTFEATPEMSPNAYLHVTLLQPHAQTVNDLPIRMYGIEPIFVHNSQTKLEPQISMPAVLQPETDFRVTVREKNGRPMTYTLAIVDDGLLDLTSFRTPDPWSEFYSREALGIRTWDLYDNVLGAFAGRYPSLFTVGGDATLKPADSKANRFKPVVKFIGPFHLGKRGQQTHTLKLPMYVGSVRTMVVAAYDGAYGSAEQTTQVRTPLMLLSTLPRVFSIGETITVPVNVFAMEPQLKQVQLSIQASGAGVQVCDASTQTLTFEEPGDKLAFFTLRTAGQTGKATIHLTAEGGGKKTHETVEIEVRNPNPVITQHSSAWIEPGKKATLNYALESSAVENSLQLEASRIPSVDISRRLNYLYDYPHLCTEQITSKTLPLLYIDLFKESDKEEVEERKKRIAEGVRQLYARQLPNGGFTYWPGQATADEWVTSYAGMFLAQASEKGYAVHAGVLDKWKRFQRAAAQNWRAPKDSLPWLTEQAELQQAFRLYTLALAGAPEQGAMNRLKEQTTLTPQARWRLAAAYALTGKQKPAEELIFNVKAESYPQTSSDVTYGSPERNEAMILETLILMGRQQEAWEQAKRVSQNLSREESFDTQSTAFALMAMGRLSEKLSGALQFDWEYNGKAQPAVNSAKALVVQELPVSKSRGEVQIQNNADGALNVNLVARTRLLKDTLPSMARHIRLDVKYLGMDGKSISVQDIPQGTDFMAVVTVTNTDASSDYVNLALTHILPSGWEIYPGAADTTQGFTYQDIRDDRVLTYFDLKCHERKSFTLRLQAIYPGEYILPALQCEAMYDSSVMARTKASRTRISMVR